MLQCEGKGVQKYITKIIDRYRKKKYSSQFDFSTHIKKIINSIFLLNTAVISFHDN